MAGEDCCRDVTWHHGQFHDVALTGSTVRRFPRTEAARSALPAASAVLEAVAELDLPVATPRPLPSSQLHGPLGRCHLATTRVPGVPLPKPGPGAGDRPAPVGQLGALLAALRAAATAPRVVAAVPRAPADRWQRFATQVEQVLFPLMSDAGRQRARRQLAAVRALPPIVDALVHGDLGGANLLWSLDGPAPRLAGVVDWDTASVGDQANDVASLSTTVGWHTAAAAADRADAAPMLGRARVIRATFGLQQALPAALAGDEHHLADGLAGYR